MFSKSKDVFGGRRTPEAETDDGFDKLIMIQNHT